MNARQDEPFEIQPRANGIMARGLQGGAAASLALAVLGIFLPQPGGRWLAWASVAVVVAVPLARVAWLGVRWIQRRDYRFAAIAFGLLAVVMLSAVGAMLQGR